MNRHLEQYYEVVMTNFFPWSRVFKEKSRIFSHSLPDLNFIADTNPNIIRDVILHTLRSPD